MNPYEFEKNELDLESLGEVDFGEVEIHTTTPASVLILKNNGDIDVIFKQVRILGEFEILNPIPNGIRKGKELRIELVFAPDKLGDLTGLLVFESIRGTKAAYKLKGTCVKELTTKSNKEDSSGSIIGGGSGDGGTTIVSGVNYWNEKITDDRAVWTPNSSAASLGASIVPRGAGFLSATSDVKGYGKYAVDWQIFTKDPYIASGEGATIAGGTKNQATGKYSAITGGTNNSVLGNYSLIGTGDTVIVDGQYSVHLTGSGSTIKGTNSLVGVGNQSSSVGDNNFAGILLQGSIIGSYNNVSGTGITVAGSYNTAYGYSSNIGGNYNCISGGYGNKLSGDVNFVGTGKSVDIKGTNNATVVGSTVTLSGNNCFIGVGSNATVNTCTYSFIGSAANPSLLSSNNAFIGAGTAHKVEDSPNAFIGAGSSHIITGSRASFIGAGSSNTLSSCDDSVLITGRDNSINSCSYAVIGTGTENTITDGNYNFIGAGAKQTIESSTNSTVISGTSNNLIEATESAVVSGSDNDISSSSRTVIIAGSGNKADSAKSSVITAGYKNKLQNAEDSAVLGGYRNVVTTSGSVCLGGHYGHDLGLANHSFMAIKQGIKFNDQSIDDDTGEAVADTEGGERIADWVNNNGIFQKGEILLQAMPDPDRGTYDDSVEYKKYLYTHTKKYLATTGSYVSCAEEEVVNTLKVPVKSMIYWSLKGSMANFETGKALTFECTDGIIFNSGNGLTELVPHTTYFRTSDQQEVEESPVLFEASLNNYDISLELDNAESLVRFLLPIDLVKYVGGAVLSYHIVTQEGVNFYWE